ncbi:hypothetical protein HDU96_007192 [Phlyctochytrium bullatum]|nr:hypothetical protein HDU96_007192 [Phlyctochytrium bullatum]
MNSFISKDIRKVQTLYDEAKQVKPRMDITLVNALVNAYAQLGDLESASKAFEEFERQHIQPDLMSYGTLLKAAVRARDLRAAFRIYDTLKDRGLQPNIEIFTDLIKGCIESGDVERAWKTFNYMRTEICKPDTTSYSLMIHACAETRDAERALDLYEEMKGAGVFVTEVTFNSLIQACGSRPDYYSESWHLYEQMKSVGLKPTKRTYNILLWNAARNGDFERCEAVWQILKEPDIFSYMAMMHGIARSLRSTSKDRVGSSSKRELKNRMAPKEMAEKTLKPLQAFSMARKLWTELQNHPDFNADASKSQWRAEALNYYLAVFCSMPKNKVAVLRALDIFDGAFAKYNAPKTGRTFGMVLAMVARNKHLMQTRADAVWKELQSWDDEEEQKLRSQKGNLTKEELELERRKQYRGKNSFVKYFIHLAAGYARYYKV